MIRTAKFFVLVFITGILSISVKADEGMWLPQLLSKMNESRMKSLGMKISAADIYSINKGSLKDAIVSLGGFCTGEVISDKGLILTNHHCGFDAIQNHSSVEKNYIRDGFWAKNYGEELRNRGLFVQFIVRIDDVTKQVMTGVTADMSESQRQSQIDKNIAQANKEVKKEAHQESFVRGFFEANQYYLFVTEVYRDVRLVGAPPAAIGNFGKDTDNWVWPRHTGDFSMFRIYANKDNKPAEYSTENVPYTPKKSLKISLEGVAENDFTMVFGFPGRTQQYLPAVAVEQIRSINDPAKIAIRERALNIIDGYMRSDEVIKIKYAAKYASIQNAYKKWQGEVLGLTSKNAVAKKMAYEAEFQKRVDAKSALKARYGTVLSELNAAYKQLEPLGLARDYYLETMSKIDLYNISMQLNSLATAFAKGGESEYAKRLPVVRDALEGLQNDFDAKVDRAVFDAMMEMYASGADKPNAWPGVQKLYDSLGSYGGISMGLYNNNNLYNKFYVNGMLARPATEAVADINTNSTIQFFKNIQSHYTNTIASKLNDIQSQVNKLQRTYMQAQMDAFPERKFYPDANSTLRVTYGQVKGYNPRDGVYYEYMTDLKGVMEKYKPGDYEFDVPQKLRELYAAKDYGRYGNKNGEMPVCFIATNHTTGGNSGSPALDAYGNLIGLNFDRVWEGTMSDINYDPSICRNIMVDIRYVMFIVDKFAGATNLINEMQFVYPKSKKK